MRRAAKVDDNAKFGLWTIVHADYARSSGMKVLCLARCECGTVAVRFLRSIVNGATKSCGCDRVGAKNGNYRHGKHGTPEYTCWQAMNARCHNPNASNYKWYGAVGVYVCDSWREHFDVFLADMGEKPDVGYTVDRINPFLPYTPENCRWATRKEQMNNMRRHHATSQ